MLHFRLTDNPNVESGRHKSWRPLLLYAVFISMTAHALHGRPFFLFREFFHRDGGADRLAVFVQQEELDFCAVL